MTANKKYAAKNNESLEGFIQLELLKIDKLFIKCMNG